MSDQQRYERIQRVFLEASDMSEADRSALLDTCPQDERLEVELLLKHDSAPLDLVETADSGAMIHRLASGVFRRESSQDSETPLPDRIGRYRIIRRIGHGGMGVVYEAEQDEPRRRVAIKVLRQGIGVAGHDPPIRHEAQALVQGLGSVHLRQGRFDEATAAYQQALDAATESFGPNDFRAIRAITSLSEVSIARDDAGRALEYIDDSLGGARIVMPADHWLIGRMTSLRGVYLMKLKRFEESEAALLQAHGSLLGTFEADDENPQFAVKSLVKLYTAWAKLDSAAHWKSQLAASPE